MAREFILTLCVPDKCLSAHHLAEVLGAPQFIEEPFAIVSLEKGCIRFCEPESLNPHRPAKLLMQIPTLSLVMNEMSFSGISRRVKALGLESRLRTTSMSQRLQFADANGQWYEIILPVDPFCVRF